MNEWSEQELLERIAKKDDKAFALLIRLHWNTVYPHALAYLKSIERRRNHSGRVYEYLAGENQVINCQQLQRLFITALNRIFRAPISGGGTRTVCACYFGR